MINNCTDEEKVCIALSRHHDAHVRELEESHHMQVCIEKVVRRAGPVNVVLRRHQNRNGSFYLEEQEEIPAK